MTASVSIDWARITEEATNLLSEYIRVDTVNPPGNELGVQASRTTRASGSSWSRRTLNAPFADTHAGRQ